MCTAMCGQGDELKRPTKSAWELFLSQAREEILHLLSALGMIDILDLRDHHRWITWQISFNANAKIDKAFPAHKCLFHFVIKQLHVPNSVAPRPTT